MARLLSTYPRELALDLDFHGHSDVEGWQPFSLRLLRIADSRELALGEIHGSWYKDDLPRLIKALSDPVSPEPNNPQFIPTEPYFHLSWTNREPEGPIVVSCLIDEQFAQEGRSTMTGVCAVMAVHAESLTRFRQQLENESLST